MIYGRCREGEWVKDPRLEGVGVGCGDLWIMPPLCGKGVVNDPLDVVGVSKVLRGDWVENPGYVGGCEGRINVGWGCSKDSSVGYTRGSEDGADDVLSFPFRSGELFGEGAEAEADVAEGYIAFSEPVFPRCGRVMALERGEGRKEAEVWGGECRGLRGAGVSKGEEG